MFFLDRVLAFGDPKHHVDIHRRRCGIENCAELTDQNKEQGVPQNECLHVMRDRCLFEMMGSCKKHAKLVADSINDDIIRMLS